MCWCTISAKPHLARSSPPASMRVCSRRTGGVSKINGACDGSRTISCHPVATPIRSNRFAKPSSGPSRRDQRSWLCQRAMTPCSTSKGAWAPIFRKPPEECMPAIIRRTARKRFGTSKNCELAAPDSWSSHGRLFGGSTTTLSSAPIWSVWQQSHGLMHVSSTVSRHQLGWPSGDQCMTTDNQARVAGRLESSLNGRFDEYQDLIGRVRQSVENVIPVGATVLVVSKGDPALLTLGQRTVWHFPRAVDGQYAGFHPADSNDAIRGL